MLKLKDRILLLKSNTKSEKAVRLCADAEKACNNKLLESTVSEQLVDNLSSELKDSAVVNFVERESKLNKIQNLGVKESYNALCSSELMQYPTVKPVLDRMNISVNTMPEYAIAESYVSVLDSLSWNKDAKNYSESIKKKMNENKEDIFLCNFLLESEQRNSFVLPAFSRELDNYFVNRNSENRTALQEKIRPYTRVDASTARLYEMLESQESGVHMKADGSVKIEKIYSPVINHKGATVFSSNGAFFAKTKDTIKKLDENEVAKLPAGFISFCSSLSANNVKLSESKVDIYTKTKVVSISADDNKELKVDGRLVDYNLFTKSFMNEGLLYGASFNNDLRQISTIYENMDSLYEIDFGKHLESNSYKGHTADIYRYGNVISVYEMNTMYGTSKMFENLTATQARNLLIEHLNYDIKDTFCDLSSKEQARVDKYESEKSELEKNLAHLNSKKDQIDEAIKIDPYLKGSKDIKELLEALNTEIAKTEDKILTCQNLIKSITSTSSVQMFEDEDFDDEVEDHSDFKEEECEDGECDDKCEDGECCKDGNCSKEVDLRAGDKIQMKNGAIGVVQGFEGDGNTCILLMQDGKTVSVPEEYLNELTVVSRKSMEDSPEIEIIDDETEEEGDVVGESAKVCPVCGKNPCVCNKDITKEKSSDDPTPNTFPVEDTTSIPPQGTTPEQEVVVNTVQPTIAAGKEAAQLVDGQGNIVIDKIYVNPEQFTSAADTDKITYMVNLDSQDVFTTMKKYVKMLV